MNKQLIIFGAGASYGSDTSDTPPLGSTLFAELQRFDPVGWGCIDRAIAEIFADDFELGMTKVNPHALPILQRAMACYFFNFHFKLKTTNLYIKLARRIAEKNWNGAITTLNYELLLESSLLYAGLKVNVGEPETLGQLELCYPHGCCHLFCESVRAKAGCVSFNGFGVHTNGTIRRIVDPKEYHGRINDDAFPPVMSYFEPKKRCSSGINLIENQRSRLKTLILNAKNIALIGIRVREHDNHIWDSLAETRAKLIYCSGEKGGQEFESWKLKTRSEKQDTILSGFFFDSFETICNYLSLV